MTVVLPFGRDRGALALAPGEPEDGDVAALAQFQRAEHGLAALGTLDGRAVGWQAKPGRVVETLPDRQLAVNDVVLRHVA